MRKITLILPWVGVFLTGISYTTRADVLDNWTTNQITTNSYGLRHVVYGNGIYVASGEVADSGAIYTSADGFNWTLRFSDFNSWGLTLNYSSGHFAGVGGFGIADVSADGTNWTSTFLPATSFDAAANDPNGQAITFGNGVYVTVGDTNNVGNILTSPDGVTWTSRSISPAPGGRISSVAYGGLKFVAVGNNDGLEYTSTGVNAGNSWTRRSIPGGSLISYANGLFIVPLNNKTNLLSTDGINWSLFGTGLTNLIGAVTYSNGVFMAKCGISQFGSFLTTSTNGTNWIQYVTPLPNIWSNVNFSDYDVSLATDGTRLVAVGATLNMAAPFGDNGFVFTSDAVVSVRTTNNPPHSVALSGLVGRNYQIQSADVLNGGANGWRTNATLQLPNTPYVWTDSNATNSARFYRGVLLP